MNITSRWIGSVLILAFIALLLYGCISSLPTTTPASQSAPVIIESPNPAYLNAQATMDAGKSQLLELSRRSTENSLNLSQAANAAAQSTQDYNRRQKLDMDYQATLISLNIAQAAATQNFISQQTKIARDAIIASQNSAAAATQFAYQVNATQTVQAAAALTANALTATSAVRAQIAAQTVQAQAILNAQVVQAAQAAATLTAYPLTATPFAVTQAAILMQQYDREQQTFIKRVVTPLIPILAIMDLLLLILGIILAYRRLMQAPLPRRLRIGPFLANPGPMVMIDGVIVDPDTRPRAAPAILSPPNPADIPDEVKIHIEMVNAAEPPFAHWIAEVEQQLDGEGGTPL